MSSFTMLQVGYVCTVMYVGRPKHRGFTALPPYCRQTARQREPSLTMVCKEDVLFISFCFICVTVRTFVRVCTTTRFVQKQNYDTKYEIEYYTILRFYRLKIR